MEPHNLSCVHSASSFERVLTNAQTNASAVSSTMTMSSTHRVIVALMCIIGVPGNLIVCIVYIGKTTTSTRAYLFALSVADTAICVSFTIAITVPFPVIRVGLLFVFNAALVFSSVLLAFLATERCLAVARPFKFTLNVRRAKFALAVVGAVSGFYSTLLSAAQIVDPVRSFVVLATVMASVCFFVVITSYSIMAAILLNRMRTSRRRVVPVALAESSRTASATQPTPARTSKTILDQNCEQLSTCRRIGSKAEPNHTSIVKDTNAQRGTFLLFVVTAVFCFSWLPFLLDKFGVDIHEEMSHIFTLNAVVNPFIYSFISPMFRSDVRQFYLQTRAKLITCCWMCVYFHQRIHTHIYVNFKWLPHWHLEM